MVPFNWGIEINESPVANFLVLYSNQYGPFSKGSVNIYGNTGPGNLHRDERLFLFFSWTVILKFGHGLFQRRISMGPKIILEYSGMGSWIIFSLFGSFSYKNYGTRANPHYEANIYFGRRFQLGREKFVTKRIQGHILFCIVKSTGPR